MFQIFFKNMVLWVESGSLEKKAGLEDRKPKKAEAGSSALYNPALCFITQLFFKGAIGNPEKGGGSRGEGEKWGREFLVQIIPWFSARSKVWEFCGALGSGTKENVTWQGQQFLTLIQILAFGGGGAIWWGRRKSWHEQMTFNIGGRQAAAAACALNSRGDISRTNRVTS